jgi:hypothetical protein
MPTRFRAEPPVVKVGKNARPGQSQLNPFRSTYARPSAGAKCALGQRAELFVARTSYCGRAHSVLNRHM